MMSKLLPLPVQPSSARIGMIRAPQDTPATPVPSLLRAPIVPATCVPWKIEPPPIPQPGSAGFASMPSPSWFVGLLMKSRPSISFEASSGCCHDAGVDDGDRDRAARRQLPGAGELDLLVMPALDRVAGYVVGLDAKRASRG